MGAMVVAHLVLGAAAILIPCEPLEAESAMARGLSRDGVVRITCRRFKALPQALHDVSSQSWGAWLHFLWMVVLGVFYVNSVTERRPSVITDRWGTFSNFRKIVGGSALLWWLGPAYTLSEDMCMSASLPLDESYLHVFTHGVVFRSLCSFFIPFLLGLHWTYLDHNPVLGQIECSRAGFSRMTASAWVVLTVAFIICLTAVVANVYFISVQAGTPVIYVVAGYALAFLFVATAAVAFVRYRQSHHVHLHHYQIFYLLMPLCTARDNYFSAACQGVCMGIAVEGSSRWSWAPLIEHNQHTQRLSKNRRSRILRALLAEPVYREQFTPTPPSDEEAHIMSPVVMEPPTAPSSSKTKTASVHPSRELIVPPAPWTIEEDSHEEFLSMHNCAACACCSDTLTFRRGSCAAHCFVACCYDIEGSLCCVGGLTDGICQPDLNRSDWVHSPSESAHLKADGSPCDQTAR